MIIVVRRWGRSVVGVGRRVVVVVRCIGRLVLVDEVFLFTVVVDVVVDDDVDVGRVM